MESTPEDYSNWSPEKLVERVVLLERQLREQTARYRAAMGWVVLGSRLIKFHIPTDPKICSLKNLGLGLGLPLPLLEGNSGN